MPHEQIPHPTYYFLKGEEKKIHCTDAVRTRGINLQWHAWGVCPVPETTTEKGSNLDILLIETGKHLLENIPTETSAKTEKSLRNVEVNIYFNKRVTNKLC